MGRTLHVLVASILLLGVAGAALAGTADDPEIEDPSGDAGDLAVDVTAGWVDNTTKRAIFTIQLEDLQDPGVGETQYFCWTFWQGTNQYRAQARVSNEDPLQGVVDEYMLVDACGDDQGDSLERGEHDTDADRITIRVPRGSIGDPVPNATIEDHFIQTMVSGDPADPSDRAPDGNEFGEAYVFPAGPTPGGDGNGPGGPNADGAPTVGPAFLAGVGLLALVAVGGGYYLYTHRGPRLTLDCPDPERVAHPGQGTNFPVRIENHGGEDVSAELEAVGVPEGWVAFVPLPTMELDAGEAKELWVTVKPPGEAEIGETVEIDLAARVRGDRSTTQEITMRTIVEESSPEAAV